jgi:radical SAM superfamily enzyme YgiQ (UPF0313 family)
MRIALIQPPIEDFYYTPQRSYPLGLTYLASAVKDLPVETEIIDLITGHGRQTISIPGNFRSLQEFLPYDRSPISAFHTFYHIGMSWSDIRAYFTHNLFDLYAISSNFYTYSNEVLQTAAIIKTCNPDALVLVGGQNTGPEHSLFTDCPDIDHLIQGEGDLSFRRFVEALLSGSDPSHILGVYNKALKKWNKPEITDDVDISPASDLLAADTYTIAGDPAIMIATSRGCPMGCRFCSVSRTFGRKLRLKSVDKVLQEFHKAFQRGVRAFDIEDDNFTFVKTHCIELLTRLKDDFGGKIKLYAMNGLSAEHLDETIIDLLYQSGMTLLNLSIATSSETQLDALHRRTDIGHFKHIAKYASDKGMKVMGHFIAGLPGQPIDEVLETMLALSELPLILGISPFYYIPGMDMAVPNIPTDCRDARLSRFWPADNKMSEEDLITLFRLSRWINYVKGKLKLTNTAHMNFNKLPFHFHDDPYIKALIEDGMIPGKDSHDKLFPLKASQKVLDRFFGLFGDSDVYCG